MVIENAEVIYVTNEACHSFISFSFVSLPINVKLCQLLLLPIVFRILHVYKQVMCEINDGHDDMMEASSAPWLKPGVCGL